MSGDAVSSGDVLVVALPSHLPHGHEQEGRRPVVVVGTPHVAGRFPVVIVVPLTTATGAWSTAHPTLYPQIAAGIGGLPCDSTALIDEIRGVDVRRIAGYMGTLPAESFARIKRGLRSLLQLD